MAKEISLGTFQLERETRNTRRFSREDDDGKSEVQYVQKSILKQLENPDVIEVMIRVAEGVK